VIEPPEECDDGNTDSGDGCSSTCVSRCEVCEKNLCPTAQEDADPLLPAYDLCYGAAGRIKTGPAANYKRAEVCAELVDCVHSEQCAQSKGYLFDPRRCWCDVDWTDSKVSQISICQSPLTFVPGKCAGFFQDASEGDSSTDVVRNLDANNVALGAGYQLLVSCDTRVCTEECLPGYFGHGSAATITEDILAARNIAGESPLCDLVADSQRAIAQSDFAFVRFNNLATVEVPGLLFDATPHRAADAPGTVLWSEARAVTLGYFPGAHTGSPPLNADIDSSLYRVTVTGQVLYEALRQQFGNPSDPNRFLCTSGLTYTWDSTKQAPDSPLLEIRKGGVPLDKTAMYTVALGTRLLSSNGPIQALQGLPNAVVLPGIEPQEVLGEYLSQLPQPVAPPKLDRITRLPASP